MNQMSPSPLPERKRKPRSPVLKSAVAREYVEFLPAALEISTAAPSRSIPVLIATIMLCLMAALLWSAFSWLDVYTNAAGRIRSTIPPAVVQPLETGQVRRINIENGQRVEAGEILIVLNDVAVLSALDAARASRFSWRAEVQRRTEAYQAIKKGPLNIPHVSFDPEIPALVVQREKSALQSEIQNLAMILSTKESEQLAVEARQRRFEDVKAVKTRLLSILTERVQIKESLQNSGAGTKSAFLEIRDEQVRVEADLADTSAQLEEIKAAVQNLKQQQDQAISSFLVDQTKAIQTAERQVEQLDQEIRGQLDRLDHLFLKAPISGTIQQLAVNSVGQVVNAGQPLMVIVPEKTSLIVEALVPSQDIGFIAKGNPVVIKVDAFPFTRYGFFNGSVKEISEDAVVVRDAQALQDATMTASGQAVQPGRGVPAVNGLFYVARIELDSSQMTSNGIKLKLNPGMTARAEIKTESRRVIDYLLSPVSQVLHETGHEQ
jgi:hemolysin D